MPISIPFWSDFNIEKYVNPRYSALSISIPFWSDFNFFSPMLFDIEFIISIPFWSDFNQNATTRRLTHQ